MNNLTIKEKLSGILNLCDVIKEEIQSHDKNIDFLSQNISRIQYSALNLYEFTTREDCIDNIFDTSQKAEVNYFGLKKISEDFIPNYNVAINKCKILESLYYFRIRFNRIICFMDQNFHNNRYLVEFNDESQYYKMLSLKNDLELSLSALKAKIRLNDVSFEIEIIIQKNN